MAAPNGQNFSEQADLGLDSFRETVADQGLGLDSAHSEEARGRADPYAPAEPIDLGGDDLGTSVLRAAETSAGIDLPSDAPAFNGCEVCPRTIVEAMLFVGGTHASPLTASQIASLMRGVRPPEIDAIVLELNAAYDTDRCPYRIESVGAGYRLALRTEFHPLRERFLARSRGTKLSQAAVDVLAIVAYQQPITRDALDRLRGKPSNSILNQLVRRQLVRLERSPDPKIPVQYLTTDRFLDLFGLGSLDELPYSHEADR